MIGAKYDIFKTPLPHGVHGMFRTAFLIPGRKAHRCVWGGDATVEIGYTQPEGLDGNFQSACVTCARTRIVGKFGDIPNITVIMGK